jgi:hypothetical protein
MEHLGIKNDGNQLRMTLESFKYLRDFASKSYSQRNAKISRLQATLQLRIVSLVGSLALILYLGFSFEVPILFILTTFLGVAILVLNLKLKLVKVTKAIKIKEPPVEVGELVATVSQGEYRFFKVKQKSSFHFYLIPLTPKEILRGEISMEALEGDLENKKTLFLHKKRVFQSFYKVTALRSSIKMNISA